MSNEERVKVTCYNEFMVTNSRRKKRLQIGDVFEIPLSDGRRAYGQYILKDPTYGQLIQVFDTVSQEEIPLTKLRDVGLRFPPLFTGLSFAIKKGLWKVVGRLDVGVFRYPNFISVLDGVVTQSKPAWYLWDGKQTRYLGERLPDKFRGLEYLVIWSPNDITDRIETGYDALSRILISKHNVSL